MHKADTSTACKVRTAPPKIPEPVRRRSLVLNSTAWFEKDPFLRSNWNFPSSRVRCHLADYNSFLPKFSTLLLAVRWETASKRQTASSRQVTASRQRMGGFRPIWREDPGRRHLPERAREGAYSRNLLNGAVDGEGSITFRFMVGIGVYRRKFVMHAAKASFRTNEKTCSIP